MKKLKIIFAGTQYFSAEHLNALINLSYNVILSITQPDRPSGRGQKIDFSPVKKLSQNNNIPVLQPLDLNEKKFQNKLLEFNADIMIVISYGKIIPKKIITMFPKGCINVHASLLPRWRGPTPIQSSILCGDRQTGVSIIKMNEGIDTGNIIHVSKCNISSEETTSSLSLKLTKIGIKALLEVLHKIITNTVIETKQNEKNMTLSKKIYKKDAYLNWNVKAKKLERLIRAFNPWPMCYFKIKDTIIKVWKAQVIPITISTASIGEIISSNQNGVQINTSYQILNIQKVQLPGKKSMHIHKILTSKKQWFQNGFII